MFRGTSMNCWSLDSRFKCHNRRILLNYTIPLHNKHVCYILTSIVPETRFFDLDILSIKIQVNSILLIILVVLSHGTDSLELPVNGHSCHFHEQRIQTSIGIIGLLVIKYISRNKIRREILPNYRETPPH